MEGDEAAAAVAEVVQRLVELPEEWSDVAAGEGPVRRPRQVERLTVLLAEILETTNAAAVVHPDGRPLAPFLAACPEVSGEWELDTSELLLRPRRFELLLPPLTGHGGEGDVLAVGLLMVPPTGVRGGTEGLQVVAREPGGRPLGHRLEVALPVLSDAVRDHLVDRLTSATVLVRTVADGDEVRDGSGVGDVGADVGPDGEVVAERGPDRVVDALLGRLRRLERALARGAAAGRGPDGGGPLDGEIARRRVAAMAGYGRVRVTLRQTLPAGTVEPVELVLELRTGGDPCRSRVSGLRYRLELGLAGRRRGAGVLRVRTAAGPFERTVRLPGVVDLWIDHVESAVRRAQVAVPAFRRRALDDLQDPVEVVEPPVGDAWGARSDLWEPRDWLEFAEVPF